MNIQNGSPYVTYLAVDDFDCNGFKDDLVYNTDTGGLCVQLHHDADGKKLTWKDIPPATTYVHEAGDDEAYSEFVGDLSGQNPNRKDRVTLYITDWPGSTWSLYSIDKSPCQA